MMVLQSISPQHTSTHLFTIPGLLSQQLKTSLHVRNTQLVLPRTFRWEPSIHRDRQSTTRTRSENHLYTTGRVIFARSCPGIFDLILELHDWTIAVNGDPT